MKKFLAVLALTLTVFALENVAQAYTIVRLSDRHIENVISDLSKQVKNFGVTLWGKEYYTYEGQRRVQLHFGNSKTNTVRFRINNDNTVVWAYVTATLRYDQDDEEKDYILSQEAMTATWIIGCIGLSGSDEDTLISKLMELSTKFRDSAKSNGKPHAQVSVWCPSIQRYVLLDMEISDSSDTTYQLNFSLDAYI